MNKIIISEMISDSTFINSLTDEIYALIDEEMLKGDGMDCELVDALVEALELLQGEDAQEVFGMIPFILNSKSIIKKTAFGKTIVKVAASAAIVALLLTGVNNILVSAKGTGIVTELSTFIKTVKDLIIPEAINNPNNIIEDTTTQSYKEITTAPEETTTEEITTVPAEKTTLKERSYEPVTMPHISLHSETTTIKVETTTELEEEPVEITTKKETTTVPATVEQTTETTTVIQEETTTEKVYEEHIILVISDDFKTEYLWCEELDLTGLRVFFVNSKGEKEFVPLSQVEITGFNSRSVGEQTITVSYNGMTETFKVNVTRTEKNDEETRKITSAELKSTETLSPASYENPLTYQNITWHYVYSDGTFSEWQSPKELTLVSQPDRTNFTTPQELTFETSDGYKLSISVQLFNDCVPNGKYVNSLKVYRRPKVIHSSSDYKNHYIYQNEHIDYSDYEIEVYYKDRTKEIINITDNAVGIYGDLSTETLGMHKVIFTFGDKYLVEKIKVLEDTTELISYSLQSLWHVYYVDKEGCEYDEENAQLEKAPKEFDTTHLVRACVKDAKNIYLKDVEVKGYDPSKEGPIILDVYYKDKYLGQTTGGYICGDSGYVPMEGMVFTRYDNREIPKAFTPQISFAKCMGNGRLETYSDIDDNDELAFLTEIGFSYSQSYCSPDSIRYYIMKAEPITEYGDFTVSVPIYSLKQKEVTVTGYRNENINGHIETVPYEFTYTTYERGDIAQDFSYTFSMKQSPYALEVELPESRLYCMDTVKEDLFSKLAVYALYRDGRRERIYDYYAGFHSDYDSHAATCTYILVSYNMLDRIPAVEQIISPIYLYKTGYEDSFYINISHTQNTPYTKGYYILGDQTPKISIDFYGAGNLIKKYKPDSESVEITGFDTSVLGTHTATVVFTNEIGVFTQDFTYTVVEEFVNPSLKVVMKDEKCFGNRYYGVPQDNFEVYYTDFTNQTRLLTVDEYEYTQTIYKNSTTVKISYYDSYTEKTLTFSNNFTNYGKLSGFTIFKDEESGKFGVKVDANLEDNLEHKYKVNVYGVKGIDGIGAYKGTYYSDTPEFVIDESILPTWETQFHLEITVITTLPDGREISSNSITQYHNIFL